MSSRRALEARNFATSHLVPCLPHSRVTLYVIRMAKQTRTLSASSTTAAASRARKKSREETQFNPNKIATAKNAARVDADPPLSQLINATIHGGIETPPKGECVVYWMRMEDLRSE